MIRYFDPTRDSYETVAALNEWAPPMQAWWAQQLRLRCDPRNLLLMEESGQIVGLVLLLDGGLPILSVEGAYLLPAFRTYARGRALLQAIDEEARKRGTPLVCSHSPERIGKALTYYGYERVNDQSYGLYGRVIPQEP